MVVGADAGAVDAGRRERGRAAGASRREVGRGLLASVAALALAPFAVASRPTPPVRAFGGGSFDETYRGRRIKGAAVRGRAGDDWRITVDGRPLHLMRRADGTWLSMVDHYTSYRTPLEATRAAVDEIGPGQLLREPASAPMAGARTGHRMGGPDGVRA